MELWIPRFIGPSFLILLLLFIVIILIESINIQESSMVVELQHDVLYLLSLLPQPELQSLVVEVVVDVVATELQSGHIF